MKHAHRIAFTLVELAIVLVIIGLLVGGVLVGQTLIRQAQLRAFVSEKDKYIAAIYTFRGKYNTVFPGDMPNAYDFWKTLNAPGCATNTTAMNGGCNGNGDGSINYQSGENIKFWMHLSFAGMVAGNWTGVFNSAPDDYLRTMDTPQSRFPSANWDIVTNPTTMGTDYSIGGYLTGMDTGTWLLVGSQLPYDDTYFGPVTGLTNGEALSVDTKIDDGKANTGAVRGGYYGPLMCIDNGTDYYSMNATGQDTANQCNLFFLIYH